jgi:hypothetical protein
MFRDMRFWFVLLIFGLCGCASVERQSRAAEAKAAALGDRVQSSAAAGVSTARQKARSLWNWLFGGDGEPRAAKRKSSQEPSPTPVPPGKFDTAPQEYVGGRS